MITQSSVVLRLVRFWSDWSRAIVLCCFPGSGVWKRKFTGVLEGDLA
jgi:hypothetical protein